MTAQASSSGTRVRLQREERERLIVKEAIAFFSEVGLSGDTTALAARMKVAQPLLYRYFASKDALIARVFEEIFLSNWNPLWEEMLTDPKVEIEQRLLNFHMDFARIQLSRERVRLSLFFALSGWDMSPYLKLMRNQVYVPIAAGLRQYAGEPDIRKRPLRDLEVEIAKLAIEKIQYYGIRKWVYELPSMPAIQPLIETSIEALLSSARISLPKLHNKGTLYRHESRIR